MTLWLIILFFSSRQKLFFKFFESSLFDACPDISHQVQVKEQIMDRAESECEDLAGIEQVPEIGPREISAGVAPAISVDRLVVPFVLRVPDHNLAEGREE